MDIEPLWALGGWFLLPNCMASAPKSISETHTTKLHPLILSLTLVFILLLLLVTPLSNPNSNPASSMASKRLLLAETTTNLQPKKTQNSHATTSSTSTRSRSEFGAEAHEVPSGPNPISN